MWYNAHMRNDPPVYFDIEFTTSVVFKDWHGTIVKTYHPGDIVKASAETPYYFITPMGGIYFDEAKRVQA